MKKQWFKHIVICLLAGIVLPAAAQEAGTPHRGEQRKREIPSPENNARRITREFKKTFRLTDEGYDKVYELYLKQEKSILPEAFSGGNMPPRREGTGGPGGGPRGMRGPGGGGPGMGGGMPPQGGAQMGGQAPEDMKKQMEKMKEQTEKKRTKAAKKLSKKMKKLLDKEQYAQWQEWENQRAQQPERPERPSHPKEGF